MVIEWIALTLFVCALVHTFSVKSFEHLAHLRIKDFDFAEKRFRGNDGTKLDHWLARHEKLTHFIYRHRGVFDVLGEVELVFIFWALILVIAMIFTDGEKKMVSYVDSRNMTEPMFVVVIMVIAASRPVKRFAESLMLWLADRLPMHRPKALLFTLLSVGPLLGSFITEPAAMTVTALLLSKFFYEQLLGEGRINNRFRYSVLAALLVNVSIGGTLTNYAAPPVLMVAHTWHWDMAYMFTHFGWKAATSVITISIFTLLINKDVISKMKMPTNGEKNDTPRTLTIIHLFMLGGVVYFSHHPQVFLGIFGFYFALVKSYKQHHDDRQYWIESLMVGLFLAGLIVIGGMQKWWLQPILVGMDSYTLFGVATLLTAITDNAALTYLGSQVEGLSEMAKYMLVAGAVTGGGLTIIANAPNPAGIGILRKHFGDQTVSNGKLLLFALVPTAIAGLIFLIMPTLTLIF
jgi:hypothetical protein